MLFLYDMFVHVEWGHVCIFLPHPGHPVMAMGSPSLNLWDPELDVALKFPLDIYSNNYRLYTFIYAVIHRFIAMNHNEPIFSHIYDIL